MDRVIFLDFDGVLSANETESGRRLDQFSAEPIRLIGQLAIEMDPGIVISSSWRCQQTLDDMKNVLRKQESYYPDLSDEVGAIVERTFDMTPDLLGKYGRGFLRAAEIKAWLNENYIPCNVKKFAILDDDDMTLELWSRHVKPDASEGFSQRDYERALNILS